MGLLLKTKSGIVKGIDTFCKDVTAFLGVRYATAGRWEYPCISSAWDGVYDATAYGPTCVQTNTYEPEANSDRTFYYNEFRKDVVFNYAEDCLRLNIWKPNDAVNAPVLVYLHGGAFVGGSTQEKCFDGTALSKMGVVVVTVEFRVGIMGFAAFEELEKRDGHTGNYGMYDALMALEWIHQNISDFGGNPSNVTLIGQSAGARMVQLLCISPLASSKFGKAVMLSGGGDAELFMPHREAEEIKPLWKDVLAASNVQNFDSFLTSNPRIPVTAFSDCMKKNFLKYKDACAPVVDGVLIPQTLSDAIADNSWAKIPYIIGSTSEDVTAQNLCSAAQKWANNWSIPCYRYHFSRKLPGDNSGAFHSSDLWYWFGTLKKGWRPFTDWDFKLADAMMRYLVGFAETGIPSGIELPQWANDTSSDKMMCFTDSVIKMQRIDPSGLSS